MLEDTQAMSSSSEISPSGNPSSTTSSKDYVEASWSRCEAEYGLNPGSRFLGNRYTDSEMISRRERIEEPLRRADSFIHEIRKVVRNADYCMLIADSEGAAVAEYCDSAMARDLKQRGITVGTLWDEPCVGTNGIGTALASNTAVTINGDQHYLNNFHQFICSAAPLVDHRGMQYGVINVTGNATQSQAEADCISMYVRQCATRLHTHVFRDFFRHNMLLAVTDSLISENHNMTCLLAIDDAGCIVGVTNAMMSSLKIESRSELVGTAVDELIGINYDQLLSCKGRLHRIEQDCCSARFVVRVTPREPKPTRVIPKHRQSGNERVDKERYLSLDELAGSDHRTQKIVSVSRRMLSRSANTEEIPILLQGETGSGKDSFARALHNESCRAEKPFVELNCAAIPESLIDSELFGYAPGTFTGGLAKGKTGHIVAANGGTLFLDEIGDMPMESQTRLLRVLAEHKVQPLGSAKSVDVNFQLVCASHRDLSSLAASGRFRDDLYYRVCGAKLTLPPLRERQDFVDIVQRLLQRFDPDQRVRFSDPVWDRLRACQWPGNIRQLHNVLQYVVLSCGDGLATMDDLPEDLDGLAPTAGGIANTRAVDKTVRDQSGPIALASDSPRYLSPQDELSEALYRTRWCVSQAAKDMGISRATVHRRMKKYGIIRPDHQ